MAEILMKRVTDGNTSEGKCERVDEGANLRTAGLGRSYRETPCTIHMADDGKCTAAGVGEEPPRQCREERLWCKLGRCSRIGRLLSELINIRCA